MHTDIGEASQGFSVSAVYRYLLGSIIDTDVRAPATVLGCNRSGVW